MKTGETMAPAEILARAEVLTREFQEGANCMGGPCIDSGFDAVALGFRLSQSSLNDSKVAGNAPMTGSNIDEMLDNTDIPETPKAFLREIVEVSNSEATFEEKRQAYREIDARATAAMGDDAAPILSATSVGRASLDYWEANWQEWDELATGQSKASAKLPDWASSLAGADVQGGVAGALGSIYTGCAELTAFSCAVVLAGVVGASSSVGEAVRLWLFD